MEIMIKNDVTAVVRFYSNGRDWSKTYTYPTNMDAANHLCQMNDVVSFKLEKSYRFKKISFTYVNNDSSHRIMRYLSDIDRAIEREKLNKIANEKKAE